MPPLSPLCALQARELLTVLTPSECKRGYVQQEEAPVREQHGRSRSGQQPHPTTNPPMHARSRSGPLRYILAVIVLAVFVVSTWAPKHACRRLHAAPASPCTPALPRDCRSCHSDTPSPRRQGCPEAPPAR